MFKNMHIVIAMIVAPILALISYFATDHVVSEKPHAALAGQSYQLIAKSNCRYASGVCTLVNGDVKITLRTQTLNANQISVTLDSSIPLHGARIALAKKGQDGTPLEMSSADVEPSRWLALLETPATEGSALMLVVAAGNSTYFAETGLAFMNYETAFPRDDW